MTDVEILLVEDNHGDVRLVERALSQRGFEGELSVAKTGDEALDRVFKRGEFADAPVPNLVLLDLNLPATGGETVLERIKSDDRVRQLPVVVLTSAQSSESLNAVYDQYANACVTKPVDPESFADRIGTVVDFWVGTATLPSLSHDSDGRVDSDHASPE